MYYRGYIQLAFILFSNDPKAQMQQYWQTEAIKVLPLSDNVVLKKMPSFLRSVVKTNLLVKCKGHQC